MGHSYMQGVTGGERKDELAKQTEGRVGEARGKSENPFHKSKGMNMFQEVSFVGLKRCSKII